MKGNALITIGGKEVRLKFGLPAIRRIFLKMKEHDLIVHQEGQEDRYNELGISHILYAGYLNGCIVADTTGTLAFEDFYDLVEECGQNDSSREEIVQAVQAFNESKFVKAAVEKLKEAREEKKSLTETQQEDPSTGTN